MHSMVDYYSDMGQIGQECSLREYNMAELDLDQVSQVIGYHPRFLDHFLRTQNFIMKGDGPLPYDYRYYLAIIAAARHQCPYLVKMYEKEFLQQGGNAEWLNGLDYIPSKLRAIYEINKILAHRPWLLRKEHIECLTKGKNSWSLSEVVHAMVLLSHFHSLSSFVFSCGLTQKLDGLSSPKLKTPPTPSTPPTPTALSATSLVMTTKCGCDEMLASSIGSNNNNSNNSNSNSNNTNSNSNINNTNGSNNISNNTSNGNNNNHNNSIMNNGTTTPPATIIANVGATQNNNATTATATVAAATTTPITTTTLSTQLDVGNAVVVTTSPVLAINTSAAITTTAIVNGSCNGLAQTQWPLLGGGVEALMERMKVLSQQQDECSEAELSNRFRSVERQTAELPPAAAITLGGDRIVVELVAPIISHYIDDPTFTYQDFARRSADNVGGIAPTTFRIQDYSWDDHGYSLVNGLYNDVGSLLDHKFRAAYNLTYFTMGGIKNVDTSKFRRAIWNYIQCIYGIRHDDYDYGEVNQLLDRPLKMFIKTACCFPERITKKDYDRILVELQDSEKVHVNLMIMEARNQAELLYALREIMRYMT